MVGDEIKLRQASVGVQTLGQVTTKVFVLEVTHQTSTYV